MVKVIALTERFNLKRLKWKQFRESLLWLNQRIWWCTLMVVGIWTIITSRRFAFGQSSQLYQFFHKIYTIFTVSTRLTVISNWISGMRNGLGHFVLYYVSPAKNVLILYQKNVIGSWACRQQRRWTSAECFGRFIEVGEATRVIVGLTICIQISLFPKSKHCHTNLARSFKKINSTAGTKQMKYLDTIWMHMYSVVLPIIPTSFGSWVLWNMMWCDVWTVQNPLWMRYKNST